MSAVLQRHYSDTLHAHTHAHTHTLSTYALFIFSLHHFFFTATNLCCPLDPTPPHLVTTSPAVFNASCTAFPTILQTHPHPHFLN